ncbi:MAG: DUF4911 domain-containing protein [Bacillota bacterium]
MTEQIPLAEMMAKHSDEVTYFQIAPKDIDIFNKIVEAYDNVALVSTVEPKTAKVALWTTADTKAVLLKLINKMPVRAMLWEDYVKNEKAGENKK